MYSPPILPKISAARTHLSHLQWWSIFFVAQTLTPLGETTLGVGPSTLSRFDTNSWRSHLRRCFAQTPPYLLWCEYAHRHAEVDTGLNLRMLPTFSPKLWCRKEGSLSGVGMYLFRVTFCYKYRQLVMEKESYSNGDGLSIWCPHARQKP